MTVSHNSGRNRTFRRQAGRQRFRCCLSVTLRPISRGQTALRPLSVLTHAVRRIGEKDFAARAKVAGTDEIATLATDFNAMAERLSDALQEISEVRILFPTQANAVFADLPPYVIVALRQAGWKFYTFIGQGGCRLMCAWDTTEEDVDRFVTDLKRLLREAPKEISLRAADHRKL